MCKHMQRNVNDENLKVINVDRIPTSFLSLYHQGVLVPCRLLLLAKNGAKLSAIFLLRLIIFLLSSSLMAVSTKLLIH